MCARLGLTPDPASTQIVARDRHATLMAHLAVLAGSLEEFATEICNLQRTEDSGGAGSIRHRAKRVPAPMRLTQAQTRWNCETISGLAQNRAGQHARNAGNHLHMARARPDQLQCGTESPCPTPAP